MVAGWRLGFGLGCSLGQDDTKMHIGVMGGVNYKDGVGWVLYGEMEGCGGWGLGGVGDFMRELRCFR